MRNIDVPGAAEIFAKQDGLLSTFTQNKAYSKAAMILHEEIKKDFMEKKMKELRRTRGKVYTAEEKAEMARQRMFADFDKWGCE